MSDLLAEAEKPLTVMDRVIGVGLGLVFAGLGVWMLIDPSLSIIGDETATGRGGRKVAGLVRLVEMVWSRPLGVILVVLGVLVLFGAVTKKSVGKGTGAVQA